MQKKSPFKLRADLGVNKARRRQEENRKQIDNVSTMSYGDSMNTFKWNAEKNEKLSKERGVTFEEIVARIESGGKVVETGHPNKKRYPNQRILVVELDGYAYMVPCLIDEGGYFLKTIIPSRKATKKYLGGQNE